MADFVCFDAYPYLCATVFVLGCVLRFRRDPFSWQASSSQMLRPRGFRTASNLFHVGALALAGGHVAGLVVPGQLNHALGMSDSQHQWMELVIGTVFGTATLVGLSWLLVRRISEPRLRAAGKPGDLGISALLWVTLVLGLATLPSSWVTRGTGENLVHLNAWAQHILLLQPGASAQLAQVSIAFKVHIVLGMTVFLVFPFTRLVHVCSAPIGYLVRTPRQIVRAFAARA